MVGVHINIDAYYLVKKCNLESKYMDLTLKMVLLFVIGNQGQIQPMVIRPPCAGNLKKWLLGHFLALTIPVIQFSV